jgi:hypothetical protein
MLSFVSGKLRGSGKVVMGVKAKRMSTNSVGFLFNYEGFSCVGQAYFVVTTGIV